MTDPGHRRPRPTSSLVRLVGQWVLPCAVLFGLHWALAGTVEVPQKGDELVYLGNARYLATGQGLVDPTGRDPYKIGYSLLLLPAFWIDASPLGGFAWVQVINALLTTALYPMLFLLARRLAPDLAPLDHGLLAGVLSCYPAVLLYATTAMSENAFIPAFVGSTLLLHRALETQRWWDWASFSALTVFLYYVHERALGILACAIAVCLLVGWSQLRAPIKGWGWLASLSIGGLVFALLHFVEVPGSRWHTGARSSEYFSQAAGMPDALVHTAAGHLWYLMLATGGCLLLGLGLRCLEAWHLPKHATSSRGPKMFWWFLIGSVGSVLMVSVIFLAQRPEAQLTHMVYGRYSEGVLLPVLLVALLAVRTLARRSQESLAVGWRGVAVVAAAGVTVLAAGVIDRAWTLQMGVAYSFNASGLPIFNVPLGVGILRPTAVLLGLMGLFVLLFRWRWRLGMVALGTFFLLSTAVTLEGSWRPRAAATAQQHSLANLVRQLDPPRRVILVEPLGKVYHFHYYNLSYFLPEYRFSVFRRRLHKAPPGDLVLSHDLELSERHEGARLLGSERMPRISLGYQQHLWVLPGSFSRQLEAQGFWHDETSTPENNSAPSGQGNQILQR